MPEAVTVATLTSLLATFNAHARGAIMESSPDDCELCMPRGREPWGTRYVGKEAVREALASRFEGVRDVHYGEDSPWVAGDLGVWLS